MSAFRGATPNPAPTAAPSANPSFFVDQRKGEVNELRQALRNISVERDPKRKRDVILKVIAFMTLGIDVSRLLTEMVMAIETKDIVIKKMIYLYLVHYAHTQPEMAVMCINTLRRDCENEDPMVRGLALRSLCSLRIPEIIEYVSEPIRRSLSDISPYVRKTAVMSILKLYRLMPSLVRDSTMIDTLHERLQDVDTLVSTNALLTLDEILLSSGGVVITQAILFPLLNRLNEFNEWGLCVLLEMASRYKVSYEDEVYDIMNLIDPVLRTTNSGAVLSGVKVMLVLSKQIPSIRSMVYERIKGPMLTLMTGSSPEITFVILKHLEGMIPNCRGVYEDEFRQFFARYNEPSSVKMLKIKLLALVTNESNADQVIEELTVNATDIDENLSRVAIKSLGKIASRVPSVSTTITSKLIEFLDYELDHIRCESIVALCEILRKFPAHRESVLPHLGKCIKRNDDPKAKCPVIWMLGEYGDEILEAPYMLEKLIDKYDDMSSIPVKLQLLTSSMKLFFKRPPEMQNMLGRLLSSGLADVSNQLVHDRALMYYRLLLRGVDVARSIIDPSSGSLSSIDEFSEERSTNEDAVGYGSEFNTLSTIYNKSSEEFIDEKFQRTIHNAATTDAFGSMSVSPIKDQRAQQQQTSVPSRSQPATSSSSNDQTLLGDFLSGDENEGYSAAATISRRPPEPFVAGFALDGQAFQSNWSAWQDVTTSVVVPSFFGLSSQTITTQEVVQRLQAVNIKIVASGELPQEFKVFCYGKDKDGSTYLMLLLISKSDKNLRATVKSDSGSRERAIEVLANALSS